MRHIDAIVRQQILDGVWGYDWPDFAPSPIDWAFEAVAHFALW